MIHVLHLDSSARMGVRGEVAHGSHTRKLGQRFAQQWLLNTPQQDQAATSLTYQRRDLAVHAPTPISAQWIEAVFCPAAQRTPAMQALLAESDTLIAELKQADVLVVGAPLYNFGPPAVLKAWVDQIVRIRETFDFNPDLADPYLPLLNDKPRSLVLLTSRGGFGFDAGAPLAHMNHLDPWLRDAMGLLGITDMHSITMEYDETGGVALERSAAQALAAIDALVPQLIARHRPYSGQRQVSASHSSMTHLAKTADLA